ncbi:MAG: TonB-dependent siderophore receptor [Gemmatimonadetes bacterium]|nr:TonB-dependent siderophore receptor [Gemmatimonadota bacterium]
MRVRSERSNPYATAATRSATRTPVRLVDLPVSLSVVSRSLLQDQAMRSMSDVVRYLPGITMGQGEGHRDQPTTRGIASTADLFVDGVRDDVQYLRDLYNVERVEALRGPNALAFGRGGGGGVLNRVLRQADFGVHRELVLAGGSFDQRRGTFDAGRAFGPAAAGRLNAMAENSSAFRGIALSRSGINPTATFVIGGGTLRANYEHFEDRRIVDRGIPSFRGAPAPIDQTIFFGDRAVNRARAAVDHGRMEFERGAGQAVQLRTVLSWSAYDKMYQNFVPGAMNPTGTTVTVSAYRNQTERRNLFSQTDLVWKARTGVVEHEILTGAEFGRQTTANFRETGYFTGNATSTTVPASGLAVWPATSFRQSATDADNGTQANIAAAYAQHRGSLGRAWQTTLGVRVERMAIDFENHRTGEVLHRADVMVTPRAGLVYKLRPSASLYASVATSALPSAGDQFGSLTATTTTLKPERFETREAGAKWEPHANLRLSGAFYVLTRSRSSAPDPLRPGIVVQTGRQESRGVELEGQGQVTAGWLLSAAYTTQRARIASRTTAASAGATIPLVPAQSLALWNRVQVARPVSLALGVVRQARMYAAIDNTVTLPAFTRLDAALYVTPGRHVLLQANVENLANVRYVASANGNNNLQPGTPRLLRLSVTVR